MAEMNFIPANELPEAVGDEIEVLCVEEGQMKRKVGRLGGGLIVDCTKSTPTVNNNMYIFSDINYDEFAEHWYKGGAIVFKMTLNEMTARVNPLAGMYQSGTGLVFSIMSTTTAYPMFQVIFTNGTWTPPTE